MTDNNERYPETEQERLIKEVRRLQRELDKANYLITELRDALGANHPMGTGYNRVFISTATGTRSTRM